MDGVNVWFSFSEPAGVTGVTYGAEWTSTLEVGSWLPVTDTGSGSLHVFSLPMSGNPRVFMRLTVTNP